MASSPRSRRLRWFAPIAVAAVIGVVAAVPNLAGAATPALAPLSAQQLIAKIHQADVPGLSGTIKLSTNLGIPNLSALTDAAGGGGGRHGSGGFNPTDLLSGSHEALVWLDGPDRSRVALLQSMAETDVVHNGQSVWTWDSTTKKVTHYTLTPPTGSPAKADAVPTPEPITTPQQMADALLAKIDPSTKVSVTTADFVAKKAAYELVLAPRSADSTIDHITIAVEGFSGLPLRVQIFAKGQKAAALQLGFSSISLSTPAGSHFNFTPPPGATVTDKTLGGNKAQYPAAADKPAGATDHAAGNGPVTVGQDWGTVAIFANVKLPPQAGELLRAGSQVSGAFGTGKLIETPLVNILVLDDGRIAVGAVNASALESAAAVAH